MMNRKSFYDQPFDSDIKRYGETNILTTGQGEDYTTVRLLHYGYIRNHQKFIAIDLSRQKQ